MIATPHPLPRLHPHPHTSEPLVLLLLNRVLPSPLLQLLNICKEIQSKEASMQRHKTVLTHAQSYQWAFVCGQVGIFGGVLLLGRHRRRRNRRKCVYLSVKPFLVDLIRCIPIAQPDRFGSLCNNAPTRSAQQVTHCQ